MESDRVQVIRLIFCCCYRDYISVLRNEKTAVGKITKSMKLGTLELDEIVDRLEGVFQLTSSNLQVNRISDKTK